MDQKHAMLYPDPNAMPHDQRSSAAAAIGLPVEAPPSYDVATREPIGWSASAPNVSPPTTSDYKPPMDQQQQQQQPRLPAIVEQPRYPQPAAVMPTQPSSTSYPPVQSVAANQPHLHPQNYESSTITVQPSLMSSLGPNPSKVTCPSCGTSKVSRMCYTPNSKTHLSAFILCLVGWCCCACIVPYCMNSCRTGNHYCSKCNAFLGAYNSRAHRR